VPLVLVCLVAVVPGAEPSQIAQQKSACVLVDWEALARPHLTDRFPERHDVINDRCDRMAPRPGTPGMRLQGVTADSAPTLRPVDICELIPIRLRYRHVLPGALVLTLRGAMLFGAPGTIALVLGDGTTAACTEAEAQKLVQHWLRARRGPIAELTEGEKQEYDEIRRLASEPEESVLRYPETIEVNKADQGWKKHLYVDEKGMFPQKFKSAWEIKVLEAEIQNEKLLGWIRNPDRKSWSLRVPYKLGGEWHTVYPDFLFVRLEGKEIRIDILDPHLLSLDDAPAKAVGLADYAAKHSDKFGLADHSGDAWRLGRFILRTRHPLVNECVAAM
jgi:hypothetical protein